jgi:hypothetical protein
VLANSVYTLKFWATIFGKNPALNTKITLMWLCKQQQESMNFNFRDIMVLWAVWSEISFAFTTLIGSQCSRFAGRFTVQRCRNGSKRAIALVRILDKVEAVLTLQGVVRTLQAPEWWWWGLIFVLGRGLEVETSVNFDLVSQTCDVHVAWSSNLISQTCWPQIIVISFLTPSLLLVSACVYGF